MSENLGPHARWGIGIEATVYPAVAPTRFFEIAVDVDPTTAALRDAARAAAAAKNAAAWAIIDAALPLLAEIADPVQRAILDLHSLTVEGCDACVGGDDDWGEYHYDWPCATVRIIADAHGIPLPAGAFGPRP